MTATELAAALIRQHEGLRLFVYDDATGEPVVAGYTLKGHPSVGYGRNLAARGISEAESKYLLRNDLDEARETAEEFVGLPVWAALSAPRKAVLMDMAHNLGGPRLGKFTEMRRALKAGDYKMASIEMLNSLWADQVGARARTLAKIMDSGKMPEVMA